MITLHKHLPYTQNKEESLYHGIDRLKRDGGWLKFSNIREAEEYYLSKFDTYKIMEHCIGNEQNIVKIKEKVSNDYIDVLNNSSSFNNATDHYKKIMGLPQKRVNINGLPQFIIVFYYSIIFIFLVGGGFALFAFLFK